MPSSEFLRWQRYAEEEPFGQPWENWLMARPAFDFAMAHTGKGRPKPRFDSYLYKGPAALAREKSARVDSFVNFLERKSGTQSGTQTGSD